MSGNSGGLRPHPLDTDELDAYVEDLIKEGQVSVEPEFFTDGEGKDYRILIKIRGKQDDK